MHPTIWAFDKDIMFTLGMVALILIKFQKELFDIAKCAGAWVDVSTGVPGVFEHWPEFIRFQFIKDQLHAHKRNFLFFRSASNPSTNTIVKILLTKIFYCVIHASTYSTLTSRPSTMKLLHYALSLTKRKCNKLYAKFFLLATNNWCREYYHDFMLQNTVVSNPVISSNSNSQKSLWKISRNFSKIKNLKIRGNSGC